MRIGVSIQESPHGAQAESVSPGDVIRSLQAIGLPHESGQAAGNQVPHLAARGFPSYVQGRGVWGFSCCVERINHDPIHVGDWCSKWTATQPSADR
jgi:hypothetical protein